MVTGRNPETRRGLSVRQKAKQVVCFHFSPSRYPHGQRVAGGGGFAPPAALPRSGHLSGMVQPSKIRHPVRLAVPTAAAHYFRGLTLPPSFRDRAQANESSPYMPAKRNRCGCVSIPRVNNPATHEMNPSAKNTHITKSNARFITIPRYSFQESPLLRRACQSGKALYQAGH